MSGFFHIEKAFNTLHAQRHPRSDKSLQAITAQAIDDSQGLMYMYTAVHCCPLQQLRAKAFAEDDEVFIVSTSSIFAVTRTSPIAIHTRCVQARGGLQQVLYLP